MSTETKMTRTEFLTILNDHDLSEANPTGPNYADQFGSYLQWAISTNRIAHKYAPRNKREPAAYSIETL